MTNSEVKGFKTLNDIPGRVIFEAGENSVEAAKEHIRKILLTPGATDLPTIIHGAQEDGSVDWTDYAGHDIYVINLRNKGKGSRAIVVQPAPTIPTVLSAEEAKGWVKDLLQTQVAHKMVRTLRAPSGDASAPITAEHIQQIPLTIADYVATLRLGGAAKLWNENSKRLIDQMGKALPAFAQLKITKEFLRKAIESSEFARMIYPDFEKAGVFVKMASSLVQYGEKNGSDVSLVQSWIDNRDSVSIAQANSAVDLDDFDTDDLFGDDDE